MKFLSAVLGRLTPAWLFTEIVLPFSGIAAKRATNFTFIIADDLRATSHT